MYNVVKTSDYVAVVRCSECKHAPTNIGNNVLLGSNVIFPDGSICPYFCYDDEWYNMMPKANGYCDRGERRIEND